jgi:hypothetical protein
MFSKEQTVQDQELLSLQFILQFSGFSSGMGLVFGLTSGQNGSEREKETEGKGAEECSTMRIIRWMC